MNEPSKLRVLVVEDHADTAASMAVLLRIHGHEVEVAPDGPSALRIAEDRPPDVALLDIGLPGLNGWHVARRLRERAAGKKQLLIAVTGYGQEEDRRRSLEAGIHLHLLKPVDPEDLEKLLERFKTTIGV
jgi:CheY-like chemotaxis protein